MHVTLDGERHRLHRQQPAHLVLHRFQHPFRRVRHPARRLLLLLPDEVRRRVVEERFQDRHQRVRVLPQHPHRQLARPPERALVPVRPERVHHVVRQPEGDHLRPLERQAFVEQAVEVDVERPAVALFEEDVFAVPVPQPQHVAHHRHHRAGPRVPQPSRKPRVALGEHLHEPFVERRRESPQHLFREDVHLTPLRARLRQLAPQLRVVDHHVFLLVALEQDVAERLQLVHPLDQPAFLVQRRHRVRFDVEPPCAAAGVFLERPVDHAVELHQPLIFAEVVFRFAQQRVQMAVRPPDADLPRPLQGLEDRHLVHEGRDRHHVLGECFVRFHVDVFRHRRETGREHRFQGDGDLARRRFVIEPQIARDADRRRLAGDFALADPEELVRQLLRLGDQGQQLNRTGFGLLRRLGDVAQAHVPAFRSLLGRRFDHGEQSPERLLRVTDHHLGHNIDQETVNRLVRMANPSDDLGKGRIPDERRQSIDILSHLSVQRSQQFPPLPAHVCPEILVVPVFRIERLLRLGSDFQPQRQNSGQCLVDVLGPKGQRPQIILHHQLSRLSRDEGLSLFPRRFGFFRIEKFVVMLAQMVMALLPSIGGLDRILVLGDDHIGLRLARPVHPFG